MNRRDRRRARALGEKPSHAHADQLAPISGQAGAAILRAARSNTRVLLLSTALASTLLLGTIAAPTPASAQVPCLPGTFPPPGPISITTPVGNINCVNGFDRNDGGTGIVIELVTDTPNETITLDNSGTLTAAAPAGNAFGVYTKTVNTGGLITITNIGDLAISAPQGEARGLYANTGNGVAGAPFSQVSITNYGGIAVTARDATDGIDVETTGDDSAGTIINTGNIVSTSLNARAEGIDIYTRGARSNVTVDNRGALTVDGGQDANGIEADTFGNDSYVRVTNSGPIDVLANGGATGIKSNSATSQHIDSSGDITATSTTGIAFGISAGSVDAQHINSRGDIAVTSIQSFAQGISAASDTTQRIHSSGDITATSIGSNASGIAATAFGESQDIGSSGAITATSNGGNAFGIAASSLGRQSVTNSGDIAATSNSGAASGLSLASIERQSVKNSGDIHAITNGAGFAFGISVDTTSSQSIHTSGNVTAISRNGDAFGILAVGVDTQTIHNSGDIKASSTGGNAYGILATSAGSQRIVNSGSVYAGGANSIAIQAATVLDTTIANTGKIGAQSHFAINVAGSSRTDIYNAGTITGFVDLTDQRDRFFNQSGGVFEAKLTSSFGGGDDLFVNEVGGTVQAATDGSRSETTRFVALETFRNRGLISTVDGQAGDRFIISNTVDGTDLNFVGGSGSMLALDVFLDGPASPADTFTIQGNVSGTTWVTINNTNLGPGTFNPTGIPVIFVDGETPSESNFQLVQPVDTGFFNYDLFGVQTGSGFWELRSFPGGGAHLLPQLVTAAQDIWHQGSNTWFDRTADLRVLLAGGMAPTAYDPGGKSLEAAGPYPLTPAVWARGSGGWLDRDDSAKTRAYGRNYSFDLDRELTTLDFQVGVDLGKRDVWSDGDALVFGMLGGFVYGGLDYDAIPRNFDFSGGQVGAYATYLNGGLFVDTLLNVHLYELSTATRGFPSSLDANTVGLRTDTGYRFGSFTGGAFLEPLATIEVLWADIDGFSLGGNRVSFDDDANVRGRLGLRAGTTMEAWHGTIMEPFVIGSVWGNLSDDNSATLVSNGRTFSFQDDLEDVWGEISGGVNFFNFSQTTAVFAKVDVTVGDDISGVGGKAGMRVNW